MNRAELQPDLSTLHPVNNAIAPQGAPSYPDAAPRRNPLIRATLPASAQMQPDQQRQFFQTGVPQVRNSPPSTTANPSINAQASSITKRITDPLTASISSLTTSTATALQSTFLGPWDASKTYFKGNTVSYNPSGLGSFFWVCIAAASKGNVPTQASTFWQLVGTSAAVLSGLDGVLPSQTGQNLVFNGDFSIVSAPTGIQSATASAIRTQDGVGTVSCNGWTRNFDNNGGAEGICYQLTTPSGQGLLGPFSYLLQGTLTGTTPNINFSVVSDAFSIRPNTLYSAVANVNMGYGSSPDAHARWFHRLLFYRNGATDFSRFSADLISFTDITANSSVTGPSVSVGTVVSPANSAYMRVAFYKWSDLNPAAHDFNFVISNVRVTNTLDDITDGTTFGKVLQTGLTGNAIDPSKPGVLMKGGIPPTLNSAFTYTSTTTSITWSWSGLSILRADGTSTAIPNNSQLISGLTASTTYKFYPFWNDTTGVLGWVAGGVGSPAYAQTASTNALAQAQNLQNLIPLSSGPMISATTAAGTGGGVAGGSGSCVRADMMIESKRGILPASDIIVGDELACPGGWTTVVGTQIRPQNVFIQIFTQSGILVVTPTHEVTTAEGSKAAAELTLQDSIHTRTGADAVTGLELLRGKQQKVLLSCEPTHTFFAGLDAPTILVHNILPNC